MEDQMPRLAPALVATVLMTAGAAAAAPPTVYIPPGADTPRFGGEIPLTDVGPVAGYWTTQCRTWRIRSQARRNGPEVPPEMTATFKRFVSGLIAKKPVYDDLSPEMAAAVKKNINTYWPSFNRMGEAKAASQFDKDEAGNVLYVINQAGGRTHWNIVVDPNGKIAEAFICAGEGL
jgi:hypothetical protein